MAGLSQAVLSLAMASVRALCLGGELCAGPAPLPSRLSSLNGHGMRSALGLNSGSTSYLLCGLKLSPL